MGHSNWHLSALYPGGRPVKVQEFRGLEPLGRQMPGPRTPPTARALRLLVASPQALAGNEHMLPRAQGLLWNPGSSLPGAGLGGLGGGGSCRGWAGAAFTRSGRWVQSQWRKGSCRRVIHSLFFPTPLPQTLTPPHLQPPPLFLFFPPPTPPPQGQAKLLQ